MPLPFKLQAVKEHVRQQARELGFDACRVTTAQAPAGAEAFRRWLAAGCHGEMLYLERNSDKRVAPEKVLAGARSIIVLAVSYELNGFHSERGQLVPAPGGGSGVIARYARFADYHDIIGERLKLLSEFITNLGGKDTRSLWYVDTGPLLERDLAQRAGLGFIGKHTNLISRQLGNWFFLSEIITTLELEPDQSEKNRCGSCTRCITACPTQAITAPFQLDARRCISYLTIELKGAIPEELRPAIGNRIFGCDDCLAVCPWNRFAREGSLMKRHYRHDLSSPQLIEWLGMNDDEFKGHFAGTPILRAKRRGFLRNLCVALGNTADAQALPALRRATTDKEPLVAEHAQWAIAQIEARQ